MILDNAPHFKVTKNTIDILWENVISNLSTHTYLNNERIKWTLILELSPWIEGFYARIIGITKTSLRKSIGKLSLTSSQLQTALSEVEAIVNTIPLIYVDNELKPRKIITPMHFLSMNPKIGSRATANDHEDDPDYNIYNLSSSKNLLEIWKKGQRHQEELWKIWKSDYLLNLRERSQIYIKHPRLQSFQEPRVGDIVQVKENSPRGTWRVGHITELISQDQIEREARVQLPTRDNIQRSIYHPFPLECNMSYTQDEMVRKRAQQRNTDNANETQTKVQKLKRRTAMEARYKIYAQHLTNE